MKISLDEIQKVFNVEIEGTRPMLMHSTAGMLRSSDSRGVRLTPAQEAEESLYKDKDGNVIIPGFNLISAMKEAASDFKVGGKGKKTYKQYIN